MVDVKQTVEGWFFTYGNRRVGPFRELSDADEVEVAAMLNGLDQRAVEEWRAHPGETHQTWIVQPKDVLAAKLVEYAFRDRDKPKRRTRRSDFPVFPPSRMATCFTGRWRDVGDCDSFGCSYYDLCILQLKAISEGAVLLFYDKNPIKCSVCHRRRAIQLVYLTDPGSRDVPNRLIALCDACPSKLSIRWKATKSERFPTDYWGGCLHG